MEIGAFAAVVVVESFAVTAAVAAVVVGAQ